MHTKIRSLYLGVKMVGFSAFISEIVVELEVVISFSEMVTSMSVYYDYIDKTSLVYQNR